MVSHLAFIIFLYMVSEFVIWLFSLLICLFVTFDMFILQFSMFVLVKKNICHGFLKCWYGVLYYRYGSSIFYMVVFSFDMVFLILHTVFWIVSADLSFFRFLLQNMDQIFSRSRINRFNVAAIKVEKIAATCWRTVYCCKVVKASEQASFYLL